VLPSAVIVARSDTMDAVMAALATAGVALVARGARTERLWPLAGAGALLGLAFDVKLAEALLPVLVAVVLWLLAGPPGARRRASGLTLGAAVFTATALAWLAAVSLVPAHPRPWALGAANGSPWSAALVYNGIDRLVPGRAPAARASAATGPGATVPAANLAPPARASNASALARRARKRAATVARRAREHAAALARRPAPPGPLRLLSTRGHLASWVGVEAVAALAALAVALALGAWRSSDRVERGGLAALALWLVGGLALCSVLPALRPRYLACVDPAVAGGLGAGVALAVRARPRRVRVAGAVALCAVLVAPAATAVAAVRHATQDAGRTGAMPPARVTALSSFLRVRTAGAADELAASAPAKAGPLIARDGRPVLILSDGQGRQLVTPAQLEAAVAAGRVRYALLGDACSRASGNARTGCLPVVRWARTHGVDVSRAAGQPHLGALYALSPRRPRPRPAKPRPAKPRPAKRHRPRAAKPPPHSAGRRPRR
jgi:4-amino-4-deoxy-L-arabinose transferase-like glycosyltransferase